MVGKKEQGHKYLQYKSLTWWASFVPLFCGAFVATENYHGMAMAVQSINDMTGGARPFELINVGLIGIGLRGAIGRG